MGAMIEADTATLRGPGAGTGLVRDLLAAYAARPDVRRIAVIGNAPLEPDDDRAAAIDACDLVIRCNSFVLDKPGEPASQGSAVHAVVFSRGLLATEFSYRRYRELAYLVTEPSRIYADKNLARYVKDWPTWWPEDLGYVAVPNHAFAIPLLDELEVPWRDEVVVPTTGTMAVHIALQCFPGAEVHVTGFSMIDNPEQTEWEHQAGDTSPIGGAHWIGPEGRLFLRWIDEGRVRRLP
jgi:hypothetical protein